MLLWRAYTAQRMIELHVHVRSTYWLGARMGKFQNYQLPVIVPSSAITSIACRGLTQCTVGRSSVKTMVWPPRAFCSYGEGGKEKEQDRRREWKKIILVLKHNVCRLVHVIQNLSFWKSELHSIQLARMTTPHTTLTISQTTKDQ